MTRTRTNRELAAIHTKGGRYNPKPMRRPLVRPAHKIHGYTLHRIKGKNGQTLYFYRKAGRHGKGTPAALPRDRVTCINRQTGLPYLAKKSARQDRRLAKIACK